MSESANFPKYLMKINGNRKFLTFKEAFVAYDSGSADVKFGQYVLKEDFSVRKMNDDDRSRIIKAADEYSASK